MDKKYAGINGKADLGRRIEMDNYMETIFRLGKDDPYLIDRFVEMARESDKARNSLTGKAGGCNPSDLDSTSSSETKRRGA